MGQEVKNPLRAQSKYGLMGSSAKRGKKFFGGSPEHFLDKNAIWDRTPPHLHINCSLHVWGRAHGSQIFKWNSIISIRSKVMAFLVILLSPRGPRCPRVIPVIPTSSPSSSCHPHIVPVIPRRSPCGLHGLWSPHVVPIIPTSSLSSPHHPRHPQKVPMWSPWSVVSTCCLHCPQVVPIVPTSSRRSPHHPQPPRYPLHPPPGGGGPESVKMQ